MTVSDPSHQNENGAPSTTAVHASKSALATTDEMNTTEITQNAPQDDSALLQERLQIGLGAPVTPPPTVERSASVMPVAPTTPRQTLDSLPETPEDREGMEAAENTPSTPVARAVADLMEETSAPESRNEIDTAAAIFDDENPSNPVFVMGAHKEGAERSDSTVTIPPSTPQQIDFDEDETEGSEPLNSSTPPEDEESAAPVESFITDATPETPVLGRVDIPTFSEEPEGDGKPHGTDSEPEMMGPHALQNTRTQTYPIVVLGAEGGIGERSTSTMSIPPFTPQADVDTEGVDPSKESKPPLIISMLDGKPETTSGAQNEEIQQVSGLVDEPESQMETPEEPASRGSGAGLDDFTASPSKRQLEDAALLSRRLGRAFGKPMIARPPFLERSASIVPAPPLSPRRVSSTASSVKSSPDVTTPPAEPEPRDNVPQESVQISEPPAEAGLSPAPDRSLSTITIPPSSTRSDLTSNPEEIVSPSRVSPVPGLISRDSGSMKLRLPKAGIPTVSITPHEAGTPDLSFVDDARSVRSVATSVMPIAPASPRFISPLATPSLDQSGSSVSKDDTHDLCVSNGGTIRYSVIL